MTKMRKQILLRRQRWTDTLFNINNNLIGFVQKSVNARKLSYSSKPKILANFDVNLANNCGYQI
jgi:hypothetical protein